MRRSRSLIKTFEIFVPAEVAERLTRICFPLLLQGLLYVGVARLARRLAGRAAVLPAIVLTLLSGMIFTQFQIGRINHSASQIVLLIFMLGSFVDALDPANARRAALVGILAAVSLAISLENLPFILVFAALAIAMFVVRGEEMRTQLIAFGIGLGVALPLTYAATIGPARWLDQQCDAYSLVYFVPGLAGAAMLVLLGVASPWLKSVPARIGAAFAATACVGALVALGKPICFLDPYAGIDPLLRDIWLKKCRGSSTVLSLFRHAPAGRDHSFDACFAWLSSVACGVLCGKGRGPSAMVDDRFARHGRLASMLLADPHFRLRWPRRFARRCLGDRPLA